MRNAVYTGSPCDGCTRMCNYTQCRDYRLWLNRCWNRYRRWPEQLQKAPPQTPEHVWRYDSPGVIYAFLEKGPCGSCTMRKYCGDKESCSAYDAWVQIRWTILRRRLGAGPT